MLKRRPASQGTRGGSPHPFVMSSLLRPFWTGGQRVVTVHPERSCVLYSLCGGVGLVPTILISSIRSCPRRLASASPYVTHTHRKKEPLIRVIRPFFIFPFSALLDCVRNLLLWLESEDSGTSVDFLWPEVVAFFLHEVMHCHQIIVWHFFPFYHFLAAKD